MTQQELQLPASTLREGAEGARPSLLLGFQSNQEVAEVSGVIIVSCQEALMTLDV